jgi:branched-chain amino acid transport system permease protein/urea transport system permease protein
VLADALTQVLNAASLISLLILIALGLGVILGLMGVINLAHGELVTIGAYVLIVATNLQLPFAVGLIAAFPAGALVGALIERGMIRFLYRRPLDTILATYGLSLILQQGIQYVFGPAPREANDPFGTSVNVLGAYYPTYRLFIIACGIVATALALYMFLRTDFGLTVRAIFQNREMAAALGINTDRMNMIAFALGSGLAALAGVLVAPMVNVTPFMGTQYLATAFFAVLVGGAGSLLGVVGGSTFIGGLQTLIGTFAAQTFAQASVLGLAIVLIRFRPTGLFKGKV